MHDCVIHTPQEASTDGTYRPSRLRVKTTMTVTDADQDGSPDIRSMIVTSTLLREMKPSSVKPDVAFNHEGGIHLSWTGDGWEIDSAVERDGHFHWVCETQDGTPSQSDGLIAPRDAVTTVRLLLADLPKPTSRSRSAVMVRIRRGAPRSTPDAGEKRMPRTWHQSGNSTGRKR